MNPWLWDPIASVCLALFRTKMVDNLDSCIRCVAAKGEGAPECDKFAKYYRSLCPGEWVDRWNEQRENGTFPGPL
ncbi:putative cytochrome-c oxidase [Helianthus annuus]|nr:putative cytochrome-c oxidase [Helianthus annuus]KAJ0541744.1 putative cytochrome-c oxidase [Helianthus annuus]KAJ0706819.1 putative cytochrome-c oxidase [Helianthus annuus]KAJ0710840.1 putative cytochrome-c oxidase [Helianthus annuus]KAJ0752775.1 putative cytochrome-c oxidase [Helianthus annuus]